MRTAWVSMVGMVSLVGGLCIVASGLRIAPAIASPALKEDSLAGVTQNWDKNLPSASRFTVLPSFNNEAVRDNNTGLVWEQAPDSALRTWVEARTDCIIKTVGGTRGWRLPSVAELTSLIDPSLTTPFVPAGVFTGVQSFLYWSATTDADIPTDAWSVNFHFGNVADETKTSTASAWCVRGPMNADAY